MDEPALRQLRSEAFSADALLSLRVAPLPFWLFPRAAYLTVSGLRDASRALEAGPALDALFD